MEYRFFCLRFKFDAFNGKSSLNLDDKINITSLKDYVVKVEIRRAWLGLG